jgi:hypothetical protein
MSIALQIPTQPAEVSCNTVIIAKGLLNPRGVCQKPDGSLLLVEAGTGDATTPFSGRLVQLKPDPSRSGYYLPPEVLISGFRSMNMQARMFRDEIMGLSDVAFGNGRYLLSQTDYVEGSKILNMASMPPEPVFRSRGNLNSLCYHPTRHSWLAVKPDTNQLIEFSETTPQEQVLAELPALALGQEAVPVTLVYEAKTDAVLISLFSGELWQSANKQGIDFAEKAGQVIRVYPATGRIETVLTGLHLPTGLALTAEGKLLVLELCQQLLQPLMPDWAGEMLHGGFQRFSGRLLSCDLNTGEILVLATELDTPSNLCLVQGGVLISEGMGLPGRLIPGPDNTAQPLTGMLRLVQF